MSLQPIQPMHRITNRNYWWEYRAELCYMWTLFKAVFGGHLYRPQGKVMFFTGVCHSVYNRPHGYSVTAHPTGTLSCQTFFYRTGKRNAIPNEPLPWPNPGSTTNMSTTKSNLRKQNISHIGSHDVAIVSSLWNSGPRYRKLTLYKDGSLLLQSLLYISTKMPNVESDIVIRLLAKRQKLFKTGNTVFIFTAV